MLLQTGPSRPVRNIFALFYVRIMKVGVLATQLGGLGRIEALEPS